MAFIQTIEFRTSRIDDFLELAKKHELDNASASSVTRALTTVDLDNSDTYMLMVEFPSHEEAMSNSELPSTQAFAAGLGELCDGEPSFHNLDVILEQEF